jgi:hypothetical protein
VKPRAEVRSVLLATTALALVLILGASYASVAKVSRELTERLASAPAGEVRGASLLGDEPPITRSDRVASGGTAFAHGLVGDLVVDQPLSPLPDGTHALAWDDLAVDGYRVEVGGPARPNTDLFAPAQLAFDGARIALLGFQQPYVLDHERGNLATFDLAPFPPGCHFGAGWGHDQHIEVDARAMGGADYFSYRVVRVVGILEMGEVHDEFGFLASLYRLRAERVEVLR